jgi:hypothetical protein
MLFPELGRDRGTFDKLGPCPDNGYDLHGTAGLCFVDRDDLIQCQTP